MASSTSSAAAAAAAVPSPGGGGGGPSSTSTSSRRKELTRALRSAFAFSNIDDNAAAAAAAASSPSLFEGYAPPESLLDLIDDYAGSSDVQRSQHHPPPAAAASTASASVPAGSSSAHGSQTGGAGGVPTGSGSASGPGSGSATTTTTAAAVQAGTTSGGAAGPTASAAGGGGGGLGSGLTGREKDVRRIQDALLEDCFNEGILALAALASRTNSSPNIAALHARARSALILVLDKFASMDSDVVSPLEVRYIWWERLLQPALLHSPGATASSSGHASAGHAHEKGKRASVDDAKARLAVSTADFIALGRGASRAARELVLRALCHDPEERDNTKWRNELLSVCFDSEPDSLAHRNLQEVLTGFYKAHPKIFFTSIYAQLDHRPAEALALLNAAIRTHPLPAFQAFHTPLFSGILALLNDITIPSPGEQHSASTSTSTRSHDLVWVSLALTSLSMLLPRLPSVLDSQLDALFVTLLRTMLWHTRAFRRSNTALNTLPSADESKTPSSHASSSAHANLNAGNDVEDDEAAEQYAAGPLPPLLDYFTTLYGLFPANLCYFLGDSLRWLRSYRRRLARRRSRAHSTASSSGGAGAAAGAGEEASGSAGPRRAAGGVSSTSGGDDDFGDDSGTDGGRDGPGSSSSRTAAGQAHRSSRAHGKGRRSKLKKQKKDAAIKSKKEKESARQKEREQRRRQGLGSTQAGDSPPGQHSLGDVHEGIPMSSGMTRDASASSSGMSYGSSRAEAGAGDPSRADERDAKQGGATSVSASASSESDQGEESDQAMEDSQALPEELLKLDWELAKALSHRYLVQHALSSGALMTPEAEFSRNKLRFKKLETSDIFDEISRTRIIRPPAATQARTHFATSTLARTYSEGTASAHVVSGSAAHVEPGEETVVSPLSAVVSPQLSSAHTVLPPAPLPPPSFGAGPAQRGDSIGATATALGAGLSSLGTSDKVLLLSSQLGFEIYLKQHLVQRLGSDLRERVTLGGLEADKQNLQHNIRTLKSQLATTNDKLEQLRHESGLSRERLNGYSQQQVARVERLREQRSAWQAEQRDWRSKLEDTQGALAAVQERFTASERAMFELLAEERTAKEEREKKEREREEEVQSLRKLVEELQGRLAPKETGGKPDEEAAH